MKTKLCLSVLLTLMLNTILFGQSEVVKNQSKKFERLLSLIDIMYVDTVKTDELVEYAIVKMLQDMDPHSSYISAKDLEKSKEQLEGSFDGIGVQFRIIEDTIVIQDIISGGPSEKVGLASGDRIIKVDNENVAGIKIDNAGVAKRLRGSKGTRVKVDILRHGEKNLIPFEIIRDKIPIHSIDAAYISGTTGYVKLNKFARTTGAEMDSVFKIFEKGKVKNIILDLTDNTGGYLDQSVELCSRFIEQNQPIVYTQGAKMPRYNYFSKKMEHENLKGKLVVLINENSASASEITSGAIQDWDRGVIVGRRSFGKGLVQRELPLTDGSVVRLTIARYYTPSGRCIQKPYNSFEEYQNDMNNRYLHGEFMNKDSISFPDSLKYSTLTTKRTVYGGGGIMPDEFIPMDTTLRSDYHINLLRKNVLFGFVSEYSDKNRNSIKDKYKSADEFITKYEISESFLNELRNAAIKQNIYYDSLPTPTEKQTAYMKNHLKALIVGDIWDNTYFWKTYNMYDPITKRAFEIINDDKLYKTLLQEK